MKKLLVIEDNHEIRDNLCELLELADYEVHGAADGVYHAAYHRGRS